MTDIRQKVGDAQRASKSPREPHWDAIRALFMLLGIPFHAGHAYLTDSNWIIDSADASQPLTYLVRFIHLFRMPGFFVIAGYFTAMMLARRKPAEWLGDRMKRLGIPLIFGLVVIVPVIDLTSQSLYSGYGFDLGRWLSGVTTVDKDSDLHLWFLMVLIYYSAIAAAIASLSSKFNVQILSSASTILSRRPLIFLLIFCLAVGTYEYYGAAIDRKVLFPHPFFHMVLNLRLTWIYAPYFALGYFINRTPELAKYFNRPMPILTIGGLLAALLILMASKSVSHRLLLILEAFAAVGISQGLIALCFHSYRREMSWVRKIVDASFTIYLLHVPVLIALFWICDSLHLPIFARFVTLVAATFASCWAIWVIVKRSPLLLLLLSGVSAKGKQAGVVRIQRASRS